MMAGKSMSNPLISIIIRAYNEEKHITRLLHGISVQTKDNYEIILVDSGSTDATVEIAKDYGAKICHISPEEFTFGRALNLGIKNAKGKYCVFASAHVYPTRKDWLKNLIQMFDDPNVALVYGKQRGDKRTKFSEEQVFLKCFPEESVENQDHPFCNNANAAIRREVWEELPYNEELTGLEDLDWTKRAMNKGYGVAYCAEAEVKHVHEETYKQIRYRYEREAMAMKGIMPYSKFTLVDFLSLFFQNIWNDWKAAANQNCLFDSFFEIIRFRFNQFYGTYKGYRIERKLTKELRDRYYYPKKKKFDRSKARTRARDEIQIDYGGD